MYVHNGGSLHPYVNHHEYTIMLLGYSERILTDGANQVLVDYISTIDSETLPSTIFVRSYDTLQVKDAKKGKTTCNSCK